MAEDDDLHGVEAYWLGIRVTFVALFLMWVYAVSEGLERAAQSGVPMGVPRGSEDVAGALLAVALAIALLVTAIFSVFLYVTLHGATVNVTSASGGAALSIPPIPDPGTAQLLLLVPPAVLVYAGFKQYQSEGSVAEATVLVTLGYALVAALAVVPAAWAFNEFLASFVADSLAGTSAGDATVLRVSYPNPVATYVRVAGVYPVAFGGSGAVLGALFGGGRSNPERHADS